MMVIVMDFISIVVILVAVSLFITFIKCMVNELMIYPYYIDVCMQYLHWHKHHDLCGQLRYICITKR